jgi:two-component system NtrC family sensor kinase
VPFRTLGTRIALPAGFFALVSVGALSFFLIRTQRENALEEAKLGSESLAETIYLTIGHEMRVNRRDAIRETVEAVGRQEGIEGVRIFNKDGKISFSSKPEEVGRMVARQEEACVACHSGPDPEHEIHPDNRSRVFQDAEGHTVLGTIRVIQNQPGCQGNGCHASPQEQMVLGVLDVAVSLEPAQERLASASWKAFLVSMVAVSLITGVLYWIIVRSVRRPLNTVIAATRRVAQGNPSVQLPRGAAREIGILASSFNEMVETLNSSRSQLEDWAETLEEKVTEKARELTDARFQVVQAEKLSSVGLVAAGIAHELNSPLMAIITFAHLVRRVVPEDSSAQEDLQMIEREANRCAGIIRQLLDYARKQSQEPTLEPCRIADAVEGALDLIKVEIQNGSVEVATSIPADLPVVEANPVQLMQVFVNLVINAVHAMPDGGGLDIVADVVDRAAYGHVDLPPHPGNSLVRTRVRDTGTGIPPEALAKVFDPFFTTKPVGKGSGLGLSVSLGIVRSYRGTILAASDGQTGTTFSVLLPVPVDPQK